MFVFCPKCQTKLAVESRQIDEGATQVCAGCRSFLRTKLWVEIVGEASRSISNVSSAAESRLDAKKILLAIDGEGTLEVIKEILVAANFEVLEVTSGKEVISSLKRVRPAVVLLDVGLADVVEAQLCGQIKNDPELKEAIVILVASLYDKASKYRRAPASLFGAEDYIERYNIQKELLLKIQKHLLEKKNGGASSSLGQSENGNAKERSAPARREISAPPDIFAKRESSSPRETSPLRESPTPRAQPREIAAPIKAAVATSTDSPGDSIDWSTLSAPVAAAREAASPKPAVKIASGSKEQEDAKRLARIIVSDIVLYNKKKVDDGVRKETFFELLKDEIDEGRRHYNSRVSLELQKSEDYFQSALEDFIRKKKETL